MDKKELDKLEKYLKENKFEYTRTPLFDGEQITVFEKGKRVWDVVLHRFSIGHEEGLLEAMGNIVSWLNSIEGHMTADNVIERLKNHEKQ